MDDHYELLIIDGMPIAPFKSILKKDKHLIENIMNILNEINMSKDNLILSDLNLRNIKHKHMELKTMKGQLSKDLVHQLEIILNHKSNQEHYYHTIYYKHKYKMEKQRVRLIEEFENINVIQNMLERMKKFYILEKDEIDIDTYHMKQNRLHKIEQLLKEMKVSYNIDSTNHQEQEEGLDDIYDIHDDICSRIIAILPKIKLS